jgi:hypothetical protein
VLCAREIPQAMEPAPIAETAITSFGDAKLLGQ